MTQAKSGDTVKVDYTGKLSDGCVFDTSDGNEPLEFILGAGQMIPGFENAVDGMTVGETKNVTLTADEAYGQYQPEWITQVDRKEFPDHIEPEIGQQLQIQSEEGQTTIVTITEITDENVTLDANHPLAGQDLNFDITLTEICK